VVLLDSNIVIYLRDPTRGESISKRLDTILLATCNVVIAEVLGAKDLGKQDAYYFAQLFATMNNHPFDEKVTSIVVEIRKATEIQLTSAIIAATAIANDLALWTHDLDNYRHVRHLQLFDPLR
jgi:predicted nucleic acid-binding protein